MANDSGLRPNTLTEVDFWAMRRTFAKLSVNPQINLSPAASYLINLPYEEFTRFVQSDPFVLGSVMHADFRSPSPTGSGLPLRFDDLESLPLPAYAIDQYPIYEKGVKMLYGQPGICKSFIALDFIGHVAARQPDKAIIYVAPEGWRTIPVRWRAWQKHYALSPANTCIVRDSLRLTIRIMSKNSETNVNGSECPCI